MFDVSVVTSGQNGRKTTDPHLRMEDGIDDKNAFQDDTSIINSKFGICIIHTVLERGFGKTRHLKRGVVHQKTVAVRGGLNADARRAEGRHFHNVKSGW